MVYKCLECQPGVRSYSKAIEWDGVNSGATFAVECLSLLIGTTVYVIVSGMPPSTGMCTACSADVIELHPADNSLASDEKMTGEVIHTLHIYTI